MDSGGPRLLLVEADGHKAQKIIADCVVDAEPCGFAFLHCAQGIQAIRHLQHDPFDACLLPADLALLNNIRHESPDTLCLIVSDHDKPADDARFLAAGADDVLPREQLDSKSLARALIFARSRRLRGDQLTLEARQDPLTGLANRARLEEEMERLLLHNTRSQRPFALLYIDLDYFKQINDSFGHNLGDLLLAVIANRLRRCMRQNDLIARVGGDEFVAVLGDLFNPDDAGVIAEKIIQALSEPVTLNGHHLLISASVGIAIHPAHGQSATELLQHADQALYQAKANGRNGYRLYSPETSSQTRDNLSIEQGLRSGLLQGEFQLHFQPIVATHSGNPVAWEALLRWQHPRLGLLAPDAFLQLAEHSGLILPMGHWVIKQALEALAQWQRAGIDARLAINLSERELKQPRFAAQLQQLLAGSKVAPGSLQLELREATLLRHSQQAGRLCQALSDLGVSIWLDNFGEEYAAFGYLSRLPVAGIKLDCRQLESDSARGDYVRNLIRLSHNMERQVTLACIEDGDMAAQLCHQDSDYLQGHWIGHPRTLDEVLDQRWRRSQT